MINKYLNNLEALVSKYESKSFPQLEGPGGKEATLDDLVWYYIDPKTGRKTRYLCTIFNGKKLKSDRSVTSEYSLPKPYNHLLKIYIIEILAGGSSAVDCQAKVITARAMLSEIKYTLDDIPAQRWNQRKSVSFWRFCKKYNLLGGYDNPKYKVDYRDRTGDEINDRRVKLLPDEEVIVALGQIFVNTFRDVDSEGRVMNGGSVDISDAVTCTFAVLSLSAPNRMSAEISVLNKQKLKSYSESAGKPVFYLDWQGSKGYKNNKNHILEALSDNVSRAINFFNHYCEPYRVISRYYENPAQGWKEIIEGVEVESIRCNRVVLNNKPNLFTLAYALGFYNIDEKVLVIKELEKAKLKRQNSGNLSLEMYLEKPIYDLDSSDVFYSPGFVKTKVWDILFGTTISYLTVKDFPDFVTLKELEEHWFDHFKTVISPSFPYAFSASENYTFYSDLLFCLPKCVLNKASVGGKIYSKSFFALNSPASISSHLLNRLNSRVSEKTTRPNLFEQHGYGKEMRIRPHQFRHFANTMAHLSDIPIEIITAWSGRKDVNQTFEYIHTTEHEESERISSVLNFSNDKDSDIRIITSKDLTETTNLPASVTSTGVCVQELNVSPCEYLNDFVSQCFMCSSACHIAGDQKAIDLFEKDFVYQKARLDQVSNDSRVKVSKAMQDWVVIHHRNTEVLKSLILLMKEYPVGSIIRFSQRVSEFKVTDLSTKKVETIRFALPDSNSGMKSLQSTETSHVDLGAENSDLNNLLSNFGLSEE
ncbi:MULTISPECIES: hypothetical protein [Halomonadaceae]|uniref:Integrase n=2 Tax=Halomonadaceae TaxID=28256 RepID=A0AAP9NMP0_9GAMM|nr:MULTISPECIES: hypothetical protein [Halomonas]MCE7520044.1 hypothetical protein [Halomonas titanicae]QKS25079.1 hypothetical protein FX987_02867 [Halomonas titanicae]CDG53768.1 conserved hypothetical protein [Halomonas sp. A3H3]SDI99268.1 hypothetical protein SAMN04487867_1205 [Halomonas titanicae]|tara:strand:- start:1077 stop:3359 length:2283 start_codon:yes stop_codon:yes gene_type:complete